jgi:DNA-binding transcriptional MocR family regulator
VTNRRNNDDKKAFDAKKFAWLDRLSRDTDISHLQFRLAYLIGSHLNSATGDAWPSQEYLATALDVTIRAVQVNSQAIAERGYLRIEVGTGRGNTNRYAPILEPANEALEPEKGESRFAFMDAKRRTATQEKGESPRNKRRTAIRTEPFKEPLKEPFRENTIG